MVTERFFGAVVALAFAAGTASAQLRDSGVFDGTESPSGRYALAWGEEGEPIDWDSSDGDHVDGSGRFANYVVDLEAKRIVRPTGTAHFPGENHGGIGALWWPDSRKVLVIYQSKWTTADIVLIDSADAAEGGEATPPFGGPAASLLESLTGYVRGYVAGVSPGYLFDPQFFVSNFGEAVVSGPDQFIIGFSANHGKFSGPSVDGYLVVRVRRGAFGPPCSLVAAIDREERADGRWSEAQMFALRSMVESGAALEEGERSHEPWMAYISASRDFYRSLAGVPGKGALLDAAGLAAAIEVRRRQLDGAKTWTLQTTRTPEEADGLLNQRYGEIVGMLDAEQAALLKAAQRRWIAFRDANDKPAMDTSARADELQRVIEILRWELR